MMTCRLCSGKVGHLIGRRVGFQNPDRQEYPSNDYIILPFLVTLIATVMIISSFVKRNLDNDYDQRQLPDCINFNVWFGTKAEQLCMQLRTADQQTKSSCTDQDLVLVRIRGLVLLYMQQNPRE
jgi:hypothetical protein